MKTPLDKAIICVIGLGYVGLPLAEAFAKKFKVIGFDVDAKKVAELKKTHGSRNFTITGNPHEIAKADFVIICVPTPVTKAKEPDLSFVESASKIVSQNIKKGAVVILESSVYPGVTEDVMKPILEESGLKCGKDFSIAYSPERINPGDNVHTIDKVTKVVSGMDEATTKLVADLYHKVSPSVFIAKDIRTAEAAKIIENIQRDLNIALMNELAIIFSKMGLNIRDVLAAAETKWNFHHYAPGLVGGHCIPVDPYYLVYKAKELDYHPQVILAGRAINDYMPKYVADMAVKAISDVGKVIKGSSVLIMGLTYKENVTDTRETPVKGIIKELKQYGIDIIGYDPLLNDIEAEFGIRSISKLEQAKGADCIILAVVHDEFKKLTLDRLKKAMDHKPILIDVRGAFDKEEVERKGICYRSL